MAITTHESQITWSSAASVTANSNSVFVSDVFTLADNCIAASVQISAANQGTPSAGDTAVIRCQWTTGDILGDSGDDYDTAEHAEFVGVLDTVPANTPGENPARRTYHLSVGGARKLQITALCAQAGTRNIVLRARIIEQRAA